MAAAGAASRRSRRRLALLLALAALLFAGFVALGCWQVRRLAWKLDLIARVESRVHAAPEAPPSREHWSAIGREDEYRRLALHGTFVDAPETPTQAVTERGPGFWLLAPLRLDDGSVVLVNRGFVDAAHRPASQHVPAPAGEATITGLLRLSEPLGGFLRRNDPAAERWHSRDVAAIAAARGLPAADVAPYFVDAEPTATAAPDAMPIAGLTVVRFANSHLSYAITWFALAGLTLVGAALVGREERRRAALTLSPREKVTRRPQRR